MKALFSGKRRLALRVRAENDAAGIICADIIGNETHVFPSFWERIKILFGCGILVEIAISCENRPGKMWTKHEVYFVWPSRAMLSGVEIERRSGDVTAQIEDQR